MNESIYNLIPIPTEKIQKAPRHKSMHKGKG